MIRLYNVSKGVKVYNDKPLFPLQYHEYKSMGELEKVFEQLPALRGRLDDGEIKLYDTEKDGAAIDRLEKIKAAVLSHSQSQGIIYADDDFGAYAAIIRRHRMRYTETARQEKEAKQAAADRWRMSEALKNGL